MVNMHLPERVSYTLEEVQTRWQVGQEDIRRWLVHGALSAHIWLPVMSVFRLSEQCSGNIRKQGKELCHWEGFVSLSRHSCYRLFRKQRIYLREFICAEHDDQYCLPDTADDVPVTLNDLVVLRSERIRFETTHRVGNARIAQVNDGSRPAGCFDTSFKMLHYAGRSYPFGDIQSSVLRLLHEAALSDEPWCSGKRLLINAGARSFTLSNLFKRKPVWREIILSDGRGRYRMDAKFVSSEKNDKKSNSSG